MLSACHDFASLVVDVPHFARRLRGQMHFHATSCFFTPWDMTAGLLAFDEAGGYSAHWDGSPYKPSDYNLGILSAPDKDSWEEIKKWLLDNFKDLMCKQKGIGQ